MSQDSRTPPSEPHSTESHAAAAGSERRRILLVDDDRELARIVELHLRRGGYDVDLASRGGEALTKLGERRYDAVITDAMMPDLSGLDLLTAIREDPSTSTLPVLMLTRNGQREDVERALRQGCSAYILKPLDPGLLLAKLHRCVSRHKPVEVKSSRAAFDPGQDDPSLFELRLEGSHRQARLQVPCTVVSLGEAGLTLELPFLPASHHAVLRSLEIPILRDIGLRAPVLAIQNCEPAPRPEGTSTEETASTWLVHCLFAGLPESDRRKIRQWLQREQVRRVKVIDQRTSPSRAR